jgi:hypothetical protein
MRSARAGQHPTDAEPSAPVPLGLVPHGGASSWGQRGTRVMLPPSLSHVARQPYAYALLCRRSSNTRGLKSSNRREARSMRTGTTAAHADPTAAAGAGREASWAGAASQQV